MTAAACIHRNASTTDASDADVNSKLPDLDVNLLCHCSQLMPVLEGQDAPQGHFLHLSVSCLVSLDCSRPVSPELC